MGLSLPPWGWWPLALCGIAMLPLPIPTPSEPRWARNNPEMGGIAPTWTARFGIGWWFGVGWLGLGMVWMWFLSAPGYLAATAVFAGLHGVAAVATPSGRWAPLVRPAAHTLAEAVRFVTPFGGVPLASLAISQSAGPLLWLARVAGPLLITWATLQLGVGLAALWSWLITTAGRRVGRAAGPDGEAMPTASADDGTDSSQMAVPGTLTAAGVGAAFALALLLVAITMAPTGTERSAGDWRVAVVQGGGPQGTRAINSDPRVVLDRHLAGTRTIDPGTVDAVLWPENVIDVATFVGSPELAEVAGEARRLGVPMIVSITEDTTDDRFSNAQVVVTPEGAVISRYDKVRRVPFGEYMPMRGLLRAIGAPTDLVPRDAVAGTGPAVLDLPDGWPLGVAISWEVFFSDRVADGVDHGGEVVVNPTNGSSYTWTVLQTQQIASSKLRAVEQGRWVVQAAPTGFSAFISPTGGVHQRTAVSEAAVITATVQRFSDRTWYGTAGDSPVLIGCALAIVAGWLVSRRRLPPAPATATSSTD